MTTSALSTPVVKAPGPRDPRGEKMPPPRAPRWPLEEIIVNVTPYGYVLQVGHTVYMGRGGRTNGAGIRQLRALLAPLGRTVVAVPLGNVLHLKSAVTALPDGTLLLLPQLVPAGLFPAVRPVEEESGCHVVPLGGDQVLIAASAPRTAELLDDVGLAPVVVDISEFEKLEGCVTCLSVLLPEL
jgi:dimethylargininase